MFEPSTIHDYHDKLMNGTLSCVQTVQFYLQKIEEKKHLNAFVEVYEQEALDRASQLDLIQKQGKYIGKLHGVVIGIKDVICYKDHQVSAASKILSGFTSLFSSTAVERLLAEGAIIIGNLNCDEFAMGSTNENSSYGKVLNSLDETRVPGGSSGGSAVAVQAGLCMAALGSDTGGSVRQPADFCGIVGFKPTYGLISRYGLIAYASSFDQIGILATNIPDVALVLEVISGPDEYDSTAAQKEPEIYSSKLDTDKIQKYRFTYFEDALFHPSLDSEIRGQILLSIDKLKSEGHFVQPVQFELMDYLVSTYYVLTTAEASTNLSRFDGVKYGYRSKSDYLDLTDFYKNTRSEGFGKEVKRRIMLGTFVLSTGYYDAYFTKAQQIRNLISAKLSLIFNDFDFILMPNSPTTAFKIGEKTEDPVSMYLADIYTVMANLVGIPAISIPLYKHSNGMPFGLQIMSNQFNELALLRFAHQTMQQLVVVAGKAID